MAQQRFKRTVAPPSPERAKLAMKRMAILRGSGLSNPQGSLFPSVEGMNFSLMNDILYRGKGNRMYRYDLYDVMDLDTDIARALDIIAEHCVHKDEKSETPFRLVIQNDEIGSQGSDALFEMLCNWNAVNDWDNLLWRTVRNTIKYGDAFLIRDEKFKLYPIHAKNVAGAHVSPDGEILGYYFIGLTKRFPFMTNVRTDIDSKAQSSWSGAGVSNTNTNSISQTTYSGTIPVEHVLHLTLNEGRDLGGNGQNNDIWPFGESYLEQVFKDYKQRSMLEDAEVIHRMQRAPSRYAFYIDIGKMRPDRAESYMRKMKLDMQQKRIPTRDGGGANVDSVYNPISQLDDFYVAVSGDNGTRIENLEGQTWADSDILKYYTSKVLRGLRVPVSFMLGPEEGGSMYNDGRTGTAYMQEFQFAQFCGRIQDLIDNDIEREFKEFVQWRGVNIAADNYKLKFVPPMSFSEYREGALLDERLNRLSTMAGIQFMSKRFAMKKSGFSEDEILENEQLWREESDALSSMSRQYNQDRELGGMGVGLSPALPPPGPGGMGGFDEFGGDMGMDGADSMGGQGDLSTSTAGSLTGGGMGGGAGGGMGGGMGFESRMPVIKARAVIVEADDGEQDDAEQPEDVFVDLTSQQYPDRGYGTRPGEDGDKPLVRLADVRRTRLEREHNRSEMLLRLKLLSSQYGTPAGGAF